MRMYTNADPEQARGNWQITGPGALFNRGIKADDIPPQIHSELFAAFLTALLNDALRAGRHAAKIDLQIILGIEPTSPIRENAKVVLSEKLTPDASERRVGSRHVESPFGDRTWCGACGWIEPGVGDPAWHPEQYEEEGKST